MKVVIVGAGAAGIAAAHTLLEASTKAAMQVDLFEARGRYGGRVLTDTSIADFAFDMGAQYIQDPTRNPWTAIAKQLDFATVEDDVKALLRVDQGAGWVDVPDTTPDVAAIVDAIAKSFEKAKESPNVVVAPKPKFGTQAEVLAYAISPYGPISESAEVWQYLAADRAREQEGDGRNNLIVKKGLGTLIKTYGERLRTQYPKNFTEHLQTPVGAIAYDDHGVKVSSSDGKVQVSADACIVTVPVTILAAGKIRFTPALSEEYLTAFKALRLGSYKKLALKLKAIPDGIAANTNYFIIQNESKASPEGVWQYYRYAHAPDVLVAHAFGDFAAALDGMRDADVFALFQSTLEEAYPKKIPFTAGKAITNWSKDPYALGAYSYTAMIGGGPQDTTALKARTQLSKPVKTVHLAGEANSIEVYGTIAGAYSAGMEAAKLVLAQA